LTEPPPNEFEKTGVARWIRKYARVVDRWHYPGDHWHGDADDFAGKSEKSKYFFPGNVPLACPPERLFAFFACGILIHDPALERAPGMRFGMSVVNRLDTIQAGYKFGASIGKKFELGKPAIKFGLGVVEKKEIGRPGLEMGLRVADPMNPGRPGFQMGLRLIEKPLPSQLARPAFEMGMRVIEKPLPTQFIKPAFRFGMLVDSPTPATEKVKSAFRFGMTVDAHPPATEKVKPAFKFGAAVNAHTPATETTKPAFRFGMAVVTPTSGPPTGNTCADATVMDYGDNLVFSMINNETRWIRFNAAGANAEVSFELTAGNYSHASFWTGPSCAVLADLNVFDGGDFDHQFGAFSTGSYLYVQVVNQSGSACGLSVWFFDY